MRLLLDTNIYVYMVSDRKSLTKDVCTYLEDPENLKYLSTVSLQELITAFRTKKLRTTKILLIISLLPKLYRIK